jgi:hypothetical protein
MDRANCRSCGAIIVWTETEGGKRAPVDELPVTNGNIRLEQREDDVPLAVYVGPPDPDQPSILWEDARFISHFATCPQRKEWRRE